MENKKEKGALEVLEKPKNPLLGLITYYLPGQTIRVP